MIENDDEFDKFSDLCPLTPTLHPYQCAGQQEREGGAGGLKPLVLKVTGHTYADP